MPYFPFWTIINTQRQQHELFGGGIHGATIKQTIITKHKHINILIIRPFVPMIFSIPRSKSFMDHFSYQKHSPMQSYSPSPRHQQLPIRLTSHMNKSRELYNSQSESQASPLLKYKQSPKKQLIYNKCKSKSYDKYLIENKKKVQKQIILKNLNPQQKRIYQDSEQHKNIYWGKKLVDPVNQKFNYFIKQQHKPQQTPFIISQFLLEPCKINSKRLEHRPFTSQSFINQHSNFEAELMGDRKGRHVRNRTSGSVARNYQGWRPNSRNEGMRKVQENVEEFSTELVSMGSKVMSRQFGVEPWDLEPMSNNLDSIRIQ